MMIDLSARPRVFISYARDDADIAQRVASQVDALGAVPFLDITDIQPGEDWRARIVAAIDESSACVVIVSKASLQSKYQQEEWSLLQARYWDDPDYKIIPMRIGAARIPPFLARWQVIESDETPTDDINERLASALERELVAEDNSSVDEETLQAQVKQRVATLKDFVEESAKSLPQDLDAYTQQLFKK